MMDPAPYYRKLINCLDTIEDFVAKQHATDEVKEATVLARSIATALQGDPAARAKLLVLGAIDPNGLVVCTKCGGMLRASPLHNPPLFCPECG